MTKQTHRKLILQYMREHKEGIDLNIAWDLFGCSKLATRISELIRMGYHIIKTRVEGYNRHGLKTHWTNYKLVEAA
ncbi:MAG: hypothetical protein J6Y20_07305 [Lachnospiraceae bacterium]|nr:hypothetical protein [Lachnospiraceae bacterium]